MRLPVFICLSSLTVAIQAQSSVVLATASSFGVLASSSLSNTNPSTIFGNIGVFPGTSIIGFPPGIVVGGVQHVADAVAAQAQTDAMAAYNSLAAMAATQDLTGTDLGGLTLITGVYSFSGSAQLTGALILDGQGNSAARFIFQIGSTLTTASGSSIVLINNAQACNVFWQIGSSATLGTGTAFAGSVLAMASVTATSGTNVVGALYALTGAVVLDNNVVQPGNCVSAVSTSSSSMIVGTVTTSSTQISTPAGSAPASTSAGSTPASSGQITSSATALSSVSAADAAAAAAVSAVLPAIAAINSSNYNGIGSGSLPVAIGPAGIVLLSTGGHPSLGSISTSRQGFGTAGGAVQTSVRPSNAPYNTSVASVQVRITYTTLVITCNAAPSTLSTYGSVFTFNNIGVTTVSCAVGTSQITVWQTKTSCACATVATRTLGSAMVSAGAGVGVGSNGTAPLLFTGAATRAGRKADMRGVLSVLIGVAAAVFS